MMKRSILLGAALAACFGGVAMAQAPADPMAGSTATPDASASSGADSASAIAAVKPGAPVKDPSGAMIGTVTRVGQSSDGQLAVVVRIDGQPVNLSANILTPEGNSLVSSMTKAQIKAAAKAAS